MKASVLVRRLHYWASVVIGIPSAIIIGTGVLLQLKKQLPWVQPPEQRGTGAVPLVDFNAILASVAAVPSLGVDAWDDVSRIDVRPGRGLAKVSVQSGWEAQVDLGTGRVLQTAFRRSDLIESLHDGSYFAGDWSKLGIFLPCGIVLLFLWGSGLWLFALPILARRRSSAGRAGASKRR